MVRVPSTDAASCRLQAMKNREIGNAGEALACEYLLSRGYSIVCRNYRCGHLETDIICEDATHILFVEVKTRLDTGAPSRFGRPGAAVDAKKRRHITACAEEYIYKYRPAKKPRIDVIEVYLLLRGGRYVLAERGIRHIENALL